MKYNYVSLYLYHLPMIHDLKLVMSVCDRNLVMHVCVFVGGMHMAPDEFYFGLHHKIIIFKRKSHITQSVGRKKSHTHTHTAKIIINGVAVTIYI